MRDKRIEFSDLFDVRAVRVLVDDLATMLQRAGSGSQLLAAYWS